MTIWERIYRHYKRAGEKYASIEAPLNPAFVDFVEHARLPCKRALDIGCGTGTYLKHFWDTGFEVEGVDSSETAVAMAKELLGSNAKIVLADMYSYELPKNSYGLIFSISAMTHGKKQKVENLVDKIYDALVAQGKVFINLIATWKREETFGNIEFLGEGEFMPLDGPERRLIHNSYTQEEIGQLFSRFRNVTIQQDPTSSVAKKWMVIAEK